jgi:glycosyltransferase involved in cell wall biosynthesis
VRVAVVHDWLYVIGGAERVLREIMACYPQADLFSLFDVLSDKDRATLGFERTTTTFLQHMPRIGASHRSYLPLMPLAIEQLNLSGYDLVISSSCAVAKGVVTGPDQVHVAYVHSPMRYAWDMQHQYLAGEGGGYGGVKRLAARVLLHRLRIWDYCSAQRPTQLVANSEFVARRIRKSFARDASVIYPPVNVTPVHGGEPRKDHFLCAGRLVSYKNVRPVVEAFRFLPDLKLIVAGAGPEEKKLRAIAGPNITFAGSVSDDEMRALMATARALVFAAEEDFGIIPVEAQAEGTPVVALGRGGSLETVMGHGKDRTGIFFDEPTPPLIAAAVNAFLAQESSFLPASCQANARRFSTGRFRQEFRALVDREMMRAEGKRQVA